VRLDLETGEKGLTHSRSASVVVGGGVGSATPHAATPAAKMAVAKTLDRYARSEARRLTIGWVNLSLGAPGDDELTFDAHASGAHVVPFQRKVGSRSGGELAAPHAPTGQRFAGHLQLVPLDHPCHRSAGGDAFDTRGYGCAAPHPDDVRVIAPAHLNGHEYLASERSRPADPTAGAAVRTSELAAQIVDGLLLLLLRCDRLATRRVAVTEEVGALPASG